MYKLSEQHDVRYDRRYTMSVDDPYKGIREIKQIHGGTYMARRDGAGERMSTADIAHPVKTRAVRYITEPVKRCRDRRKQTEGRGR